MVERWRLRAHGHLRVRSAVLSHWEGHSGENPRTNDEKQNNRLESLDEAEAIVSELAITRQSGLSADWRALAPDPFRSETLFSPFF